MKLGCTPGGDCENVLQAPRRRKTNAIGSRWMADFDMNVPLSLKGRTWPNAQCPPIPNPTLGTGLLYLQDRKDPEKTKVLFIGVDWSHLAVDDASRPQCREKPQLPKSRPREPSAKSLKFARTETNPAAR